MAEARRRPRRARPRPQLVERAGRRQAGALNLRFRNATGQLDNTAEISTVRRQIARINTLIRQREIAAAEAVEDREGPLMADDPHRPGPTARHARKVREGVVVSNKMDKTAVVAVVERVRHPKYDKFVMRTKKLYAHDEANDVNVGDQVRVDGDPPARPRTSAGGSSRCWSGRSTR